MILDRAWRGRRWGIIADDLTGATDVAAAFARAGFPALVLFERRRIRESPARVIVLSTHSRQSSPAAAKRQVRVACRWLSRHGITLLYKKLDSTLHGNIATEIAAIRDDARFETALFCPANPAQGRLVQHGRLIVRGEDRGGLLERLEIPPSKSDSFTSVNASSTALALRRALNESRFVLANATNFSHLGKLVTGALRSKRRVLLAGSAGMAWALAQKLSRTLGARSHPHRTMRTHLQDPAQRPFMVFSGSASPVTHRQIRLLQKRKKARVLTLTPQSATRARQALAAGRTVIVRVPVHAQSERKILADLRRFSPLVRDKETSGLVLVGGDTGFLLCRWLQPRALAIEGEILPGLAWGRWVGGLADGLRLCTKPGGFGTEDALEKITRL